MTQRYSFLRSGVWIAGFLIVALTVVLFVSLGLWQMRRLDDRKELNSTIEARMAQGPIDLTLLVADAGVDPAETEYRRVIVEGTYDVEQEILLQARTLNSQSGHNVVTPLAWEGGTLAVNRGWVPIDSLGPPVPDASPPAAEVEVIGILRASEDRGPTGATGPDGTYAKIGRIDLVLLDQQWGPSLFPMYLQLQTQDPTAGEYPIPLPPPETTEGAHLSYAIQWFIFATIAVVGFAALISTTAKRRDPRTSARPSTPSSAP